MKITFNRRDAETPSFKDFSLRLCASAVYFYK